MGARLVLRRSRARCAARSVLRQGGRSPCDLPLGRAGEPGRRAFAASPIHAHVERPVTEEAEAARRVIELGEETPSRAGCRPAGAEPLRAHRRGARRARGRRMRAGQRQTAVLPQRQPADRGQLQATPPVPQAREDGSRVPPGRMSHPRRTRPLQRERVERLLQQDGRVITRAVPNPPAARPRLQVLQRKRAELRRQQLADSSALSHASRRSSHLCSSTTRSGRPGR